MQITGKNNIRHTLQALFNQLPFGRIAVGALLASALRCSRTGRLLQTPLPRRVLAILVMLAMPAGHASETVGDFHLYAQPSICVSYNSDEPCLMSMEVSWEGDKPVDVCLRDAAEEPMLYCWENTSEGRIEIDYANTGDVLYQLVDEASLGVLAETEIKVINRDLRSSRKRRRHVWSIL